jgi:hypothetical protein
MEDRGLLRKLRRRVLKAALCGAGVATGLSLLIHAAALLSPGRDALGLLFILGQPADMLEKAVGIQLSPDGPSAEAYLLVYAVNAVIGAVIFALPALFALVDYYRKDQPK